MPAMPRDLRNSIEENKDNAIGPWAFSNYLMYKDFTESDIDALCSRARPPSMPT